MGEQLRRWTSPCRRARLCVPLFLLTLVACSLLISQTKSPVTPSVAEEQDFAFALGLYRDGLYQLAHEQLQKFSETYPNSLKRSEALFLENECLFFTEHLSAARQGYAQYLREYPRSTYADDAWFRTGEIQLKAKQPSAAVASFKKVLDDFSDSDLAGEAAYWAGESYLQSEDFQNAIKYYTLSYENFPKNRVRDFALYSLAWTNQKRGSYPAAVQTYRTFLQEFPNSSLAASARIRIGECAFYAKDYRQALTDLADARGLIQDSTERGEAAYLIAESHYQLGDYSEAANQFRLFVDLYPAHKFVREASYSLGWALIKLQTFDSARTVFDRLSGGQDDIAHASLFRRGALEKQLGNPAAAEETFKQVIVGDSSGEFSDNAFYERGLLQYDAAKYTDAFVSFERVSQSYPQSDVLGDAIRMAGESLVMLQRFAEARDRFSRALHVADLPFDSKVAAEYQHGWCAFKLNEYAAASTELHAFAAKYAAHPRAADAYFWAGEADYAQGKYSEAISAYNLVPSNGSKKPEALYGLGWSYFKLHDFSASISAFEQFIAASPKHPLSLDARLRLGDCYFNQKDFKKAAASFRVVLRLYPDSAAADYASYQAGQSLFRDGDASGAFQQFAELTKKFPNSALADDAQYAMGWVNFQRKDFSEAIKEFQKTAANYPTSDNAPRALYSLGDCYYNLKQFVAAEKSYREVLNRFPESKFVADAVTGIQYCLVAQGKQQQALDVIDEFLKENPSASTAEDLTLRKAELLFNAKEFASAAGAYKSFATQFPKSKQVPLATLWLARCYKAQKNLDEAAQTFERVGRLTGAPETLRKEAILESAAAYEQLQRPEKNLDLLETGERELQDEQLLGELHAYHGEVLVRMGKQGEALAQFARAVQVAPSSDEADRARVSSAGIKLNLQDFASARTFAERVSTSRTDALGAEAQVIAGRALFGLQDTAAAITALLRVRYVFSTQEFWVGTALLRLGEIYESQHAPTKAAEAYTSAAKLKSQRELAAEAETRLKRLKQK